MKIIEDFKKQPLFIKILDILSPICIFYEIITFLITGSLNETLLPGIIIILSISLIFRVK